MGRLIAIFDILAAETVILCLVFIAIECYKRWYNFRTYEQGRCPRLRQEPIELAIAILVCAVAVLLSRFLA